MAFDDLAKMKNLPVFANAVLFENKIFVKATPIINSSICLFIPLATVTGLCRDIGP